MAQPTPDPSWEPDDVDEVRRLPLDPDVDRAQDARHPPSSPPFPGPIRSRWPRIHWWTVMAVGVGGFVGGIARYAAGLLFPAPAGAFPWTIFAVNTAGAFVLALLLVLVLEVLPPTTYLRPVVGTGFCGALTTFSSVATGVDQLAAHGHAGLAAGYLGASVSAGLAAASFGVVTGRAIAAQRDRSEE